MAEETNPGRTDVEAPPFDPDTESLATGRSAISLDNRDATIRRVQLERTASSETKDQALWVAIRRQTRAIGFLQYRDYIDEVLCKGDFSGSESTGDDTGPISDSNPNLDTNPNALYAMGKLKSRRDSLVGRPSILGVDAYKLLRVATEAFLVARCGLHIDPPGYPMTEADLPEENRRLGYTTDLTALRKALSNYLGDEVKALPYLRRITDKLVGMNDAAEHMPFCDSILAHRLTCPSLTELIWSYWHEEGMLIQTINAITLRFQNRLNGPNDPLVNLALDPLRPMSNLLWGFVQEESKRLSLRRRAYEYDSHYGFRMRGKALSNFSPVDSRSKFIEAFHNLLHRAILFYREDDDTTIVADAFTLLNCLRELHIILAEGAHNQYGDLPWTARREMLMMQWLLTRPEMREFLRGRHMVPYQEPWMGAVDDMKRIKGWCNVSVTHFHELAIYGEQILLSVRFGDWIDINEQDHARNWARYWRAEIQRYVHSYCAVTGVDVASELTDQQMREARLAQPSLLIEQRYYHRTTPQLRSRRPTSRGRGREQSRSGAQLSKSGTKSLKSL